MRVSAAALTVLASTACVAGFIPASLLSTTTTTTRTFGVVAPRSVSTGTSKTNRFDLPSRLLATATDVAAKETFEFTVR